MEDVKNDDRFSHITKDPRYWKMKRKDQKIKIDKRFDAMFKDKKFKLKYSVDKRGRPINKTTNEDLRKFYDLSDSDSDSDTDASTEKVKSMSTTKKDKSAKTSVETEKHSTPTEKDYKTTRKIKKDKDSETSRNIKSKSIKTKVKEPPFRSKEELPDDDGDQEDNDMSDDEIDSDSPDEENVQNTTKGEDISNNDAESDNSESSEYEDEDIRKKGVGHIDLARGEGNIATSSEESSDEEEEGDDQVNNRPAAIEQSSSDDTDDEDTNVDDFDHKWAELDTDATEAKDITSRLAICNMDWDRIKAQDLLVLLNSFKPTGGVILSVKIYPSEFGLERMKREEQTGPTELVQEKLSGDAVDGDDQEGNEYHREKLRKYQLQRLKYFYAVVECNSPETANKIYEECDGLEYEASSARLDLRFIPDDMTFDQKPKSEASEMPDQALYKPSLFFTTALNQSSVALTWDETDKDRQTVLRRKFTKDELEDMDVKAYLASSSGSEDEGVDPYAGLEFSDEGSVSGDSDANVEKYKQLLKGLDTNKEEEQNDEGLEITWEPGLKEATEDLVKKKSKEKDGQNPWDIYLEKRKQKKIKKREEKMKGGKKVEIVERDEDDDSDKGVDDAFSDDDLPEGVDLDDPYFTTSLNTEVTKSQTAELTKKKKKYRKGKKPKEPIDEETKQKAAELELLMMDEDDHKQHFNLKDIMEREKKTKNKKKLRKMQEKLKEAAQDTFKMDVNDPRFAAVYDSHMYNIDPSAPEYKKTIAIDAIVQEKFKRKTSKKTVQMEGETITKLPKTDSRPGDVSLSALVKSVKSKTAQFQQKKKKTS